MNWWHNAPCTPPAGASPTQEEDPSSTQQAQLLPYGSVPRPGGDTDGWGETGDGWSLPRPGCAWDLPRALAVVPRRLRFPAAGRFVVANWEAAAEGPASMRTGARGAQGDCWPPSGQIRTGASPGAEGVGQGHGGAPGEAAAGSFGPRLLSRWCVWLSQLWQGCLAGEKVCLSGAKCCEGFLSNTSLQVPGCHSRSRGQSSCRDPGTRSTAYPASNRPGCASC